MNTIPTVVLKSGIKIANFSSPHPFTFDDGSVLPACSPERAKALMLNAEEVEHDMGAWTDIELKFSLSDNVTDELIETAKNLGIDIILVPFPVMTALKDEFGDEEIGKCRVCRLADRVTKVISSTKFCR